MRIARATLLFWILATGGCLFRPIWNPPIDPAGDAGLAAPDVGRQADSTPVFTMDVGASDIGASDVGGNTDICAEDLDAGPDATRRDGGTRCDGGLTDVAPADATDDAVTPDDAGDSATSDDAGDAAVSANPDGAEGGS